MSGVAIESTNADDCILHWPRCRNCIECTFVENREISVETRKESVDALQIAVHTISVSEQSDTTWVTHGGVSSA